MDCTAILAEVQSNNAKVQQLASDQGLKTTQNVAAGVAGILSRCFGLAWTFKGPPIKRLKHCRHASNTLHPLLVKGAV